MHTKQHSYHFSLAAWSRPAPQAVFLELVEIVTTRRAPPGCVSRINEGRVGAMQPG